MSKMHDTMRHGTTRNEKRVRNVLIKNGKFYVAPQKNSRDIKEILSELAAAGAGRPVDADGFPVGAWKPDQLQEAISSVSGDPDSVDIRTVQGWLQENERGISPENIRWLARVFGCDDPEATAEWQKALSAGQSLLNTRRRLKKRDQVGDPDLPTVAPELQHPTAPASPPDGLKHPDARKPGDRKRFAEKCEWLLEGANSVNLLVVYWVVYAALGLMNYAMGTFSVTYSPYAGLDKQVGFIWAPTLTILPVVVLPLFITALGGLLTYWKDQARPRLARAARIQDTDDIHDRWMMTVNSFSVSFWLIMVFCLIFVFGFQWAGIYLPIYESGELGGVQVDRYLVTIPRPDVLTTNEAIVLSAFGYLYSASYVTVFLLGLLFLFIVVLDFHDVCIRSKLKNAGPDGRVVQEAATRIAWGCFSVATWGLWLAILIKLQIVYLSSDGENFVAWIFNDFMFALGFSTVPNGWLDNESVSHFTTFLMMTVTVATFVFSATRINVTRSEFVPRKDKATLKNENALWMKMGVVVFLLCATLMLIGQIVGFSIVLLISVLASYVLVVTSKSGGSLVR